MNNSSIWYTDIPVIILSARSGADDWGRGLELGVSDYLTKPFNIPAVKACIDKQLSAANKE